MNSEVKGWMVLSAVMAVVAVLFIATDRVVATERERCAKVAGDAWMDGVPIAEIPAIIRKGDTP